MRARYYKPAQGRFTQQDGWAYANPQDPLSLNLYTYCWNNPVIYIDYSGNSPWLAILLLIAASVLFSGCSNNAHIPKYEPDKWNTEEYLNYTNCYAYAFDMMENPITGEKFPKKGLQLGMLSGEFDYENLTVLDIHRLNLLLSGTPAGNAFLVDTISRDMETVGIQFQEYSEGMEGGYKVALFVNPDEKDIHWYRENEDGSWSHKLGNSNVTNEVVYRDATLDKFVYTGEIIYDPVIAAERAGYSVFVGYFYVSK